MERVIPWLADTAGVLPFDTNNDCDVDLADYSIFRICLEQPMPLNPGHVCIATYAMDRDGDRDIDLREFALFQEVFTGTP